MTFKSQILSLAALSLTLTACSGSEEKKEVVVEEVLPVVKIEKVYAEEVPQIISYTATVEPFKSNNITANASNRIKDIKVDVGQNVVAGQTLLFISNVNVEQLELRVAHQQRNYERAVELFELGGGTQQSVEQLKTELAKRIVKVTFLKKDGTITTRNATTTPSYAGQFVNGNGYSSDIRNVVSFIDIDAEGTNRWRSFRYEKLISWE